MEGVEIQNWRYDEYPLIRFLERHDLDVSYVTDWDVSSTPGILAGHRVVMTSGHDEYWTHEHRDALEAARDAGQSLAFMGANTGYWQVRYANGGRSLIGYKSSADPIADPALKTTLFRDVGRPECELLGVQYNNTGWSLGTSADLSVVDGSLADPWLAGAGFTAGASVPETMGYEWDQVTAGCATPPLTRLFHWQASGWPSADAVRYTAPSGAKVFAAGSLQFSWGLDGWRYSSAAAAPDARLEAFTLRMLADMSGPAQPSVVVSPTTASVPVGATQQFTASLQNASGGVQWSVEGVAGGNASVGTISAGGLYTAPDAVPAGGSVSVRATHLASGASDAATVSVTVATPPSVVVSPKTTSVPTGATRQFAASLQNASGGVQWSVNYIDGGNASVGTISAGGLYTAPDAVPAGGSVRVRATHLASGASDAAAVTVTAATPGGGPAPPPALAAPTPPAAVPTAPVTSVTPLTLRITGSRKVRRGTRARFVYRVTNATKARITAVVIVNTLPRGLSIDRTSRRANLRVKKKSLRFTGGGRRVTFRLGTIGAGKVVVVWVDARVSPKAAKGTRRNTLRILRDRRIPVTRVTGRVIIG